MVKAMSTLFMNTPKTYTFDWAFTLGLQYKKCGTSTEKQRAKRPLSWHVLPGSEFSHFALLLSNQTNTLARSFRVRLSWGCKARHFHHISICPLSLLSQAKTWSHSNSLLAPAARPDELVARGEKVRRLMAKPQTYFPGVIADPSLLLHQFLP